MRSSRGLEAGQQRVADHEARRRVERRLRVETLADSPTLKAAVDTFIFERAAGGPLDQLAGTIAGELAKLQRRLGVPALAVADVDGRVLEARRRGAGTPARSGMTENRASLVQFWQHGYGAARSTNVVVGGGLTPRQGLRVGAAFARGEYAKARSSRPALGYRMTNVEFDYAVGHTRVSGEWTRDAFESLAGDRVARGWTVQAEHAVTPRVFVHARLTRVVAPQADSIASPTAVNRTYRSIDSTVGIRLTPEVILRAAHSAIRRFDSLSTDHQVGLSLMWARRWW